MTKPLLAVGRRVRQRHLLRAVERVGRPGSVFDAGCGDGRVLAAIGARWPEARLLGIDPDPAAVELARANLSGRPRADVRLGSIGDESVGGGFDLIVCADVLEHVADDTEAFRWLGSQIAPGGWLVAHVPSSPQRHLFSSIDRSVAREVARGHGPHLREGYDRETLESLIEEGGLELESVGWTFHTLAVRAAEDIDTLLFQRRAKAIKALALPLLLAASEAERALAPDPPGYGVLVTARRTKR